MSDFVPARWYTQGRIASVDVLVLHATQGYVGNVRGLAADFAHRPATAKASSHSGVDDHGRLDFVHFDDTAYAAPGANADGEHLEMCAMSEWHRDTWLDHPGLLEQAARWLAHRCQARHIPPVFLDAAELRSDRRGITTHRQVSAAFHQTDHSDPGPDFPMARVLDRVHVLLAQAHTPAGRTHRHPPAYPGLLHLGSHGPGVAAWQRRLRNRWNYQLVVDGSYGARTGHVTREFQRHRHLVVDGRVGPRTWAAAWPS